MREILSVDLTPQGYLNRLALPYDYSSTKDSLLKAAFEKVWRKSPQPGTFFRSSFERTKTHFDATFDAIFKRENVIVMAQDLFYAILPILDANGERFHNKFHYIIATDPLPEYTGIPDRTVIAKIGVELEGGWNAYSDHIKSDGSVSGVKNPGEIAFPPFHPDEFPWIEPVNLPGFQNIRSGTMGSFTSMYPDHVNHTCGMHVHVSFPSTGMYAAFVDVRFQPWLVRGLHQWGLKGHIKSKAFYSRLQGGQSYCRDIYAPESQLSGGGGQRYSIVNYCYPRYKTMEIRVLPMFKDVRFSIKAIKALVKLINIWGCAFGPASGSTRLASFAEEETETKIAKAKAAPAKTTKATRKAKLASHDVVFGYDFDNYPINDPYLR